MKKKIAVLLFIILFGVGLYIAYHKPMWNDEFYSMSSSTMGKSYVDILGGKVLEGNNSPAFYGLQKLQCDAFSYQPPAAWIEGDWSKKDPYSQLFLRVQPVFFMALAMVVLFYYFARNDSILIGFYALATALSSFMFWEHCVEARPYALLFFLTTVQILLLVDIFRKNERVEDKTWGYLALIHLLLALTASVSVLQIAACSLTLWIFGQRRLRVFIFMTVVPVAMCLFYYALAPKYGFFFKDGPMALINASISKDRMVLLGLGAGLSLYVLRNKWFVHAEGRYIVFLVSLLAACVAVLVKLKLEGTSIGEGFQISGRYFLALAPAGSVGVALLASSLLRTQKSGFGWVFVFGVLMAFLLFRFYRVLPFIHLF